MAIVASGDGWSLDDAGLLTISFTGNMPDYDTSGAPWWGAYVRRVIISDSVTRIGDNAFYDRTSLESVTIPDSVTRIGDYAFYN